MIFVTVGTHEQPFNRLIQKVDELKRDGVIKDDVIIQTGFSTYKPKYCQWSKLISYQQMVKNVADARIVITHGGPASFIMPLQIGKTPIVVPRQHQFNEHVNDHQVEFARNVAQRMGTIIPVEDIETLGDIITNYDQIVAGMGHGMSSNNAKFNGELEHIVDEQPFMERSIDCKAGYKHHVTNEYASKFYHGDYYLEELKTIEGKRFGDRGKHQFK